MRCTASARASVTAEPSMETGFVSARSTFRSVPERVAFTVNADAAGTALSSSGPLKVTVSSSPFTDADEYAGGVTLGTSVPLSTACGTLLPDRSLS